MNARTFPLSWRWTSPGHAEFSDTEFSRIRPLDIDEARRFDQAARARVRGDGFAVHPDELETISFSAAPENSARAKLLDLIPGDVETVILSWEPNIAAEVSVELFVWKWSDFLYPSSDDVEILPLHGEWFIAYRHWEEFFFGSPRTV